MEREELKTLIDSGNYRPEPAQIAQAMLSRRSVRTLLTTGSSLSPAGRIQPAAASRRHAA